MAGEVVPFGKYKGQPVETLMADEKYREWLMAQPWFRDQFKVIYQTIINYGGQPQDSPEHNQMQARFLEPEHCLALANFITDGAFDETEAKKEPLRDAYFKQYRSFLSTKIVKARVSMVQFENRGWDVTFRAHTPEIHAKIKSLPNCVCPSHCICDHSACRHDEKGYLRYCKWKEHSERSLPDGKCQREYFYHCGGCLWADQKINDWFKQNHTYNRNSFYFYIECKPDLGDDFPTVLRQIQRYESNGNPRIVVVRRANFAMVTWEQVQQIFNNSGISLIKETDFSEVIVPTADGLGDIIVEVE